MSVFPYHYEPSVSSTGDPVWPPTHVFPSVSVPPWPAAEDPIVVKLRAEFREVVRAIDRLTDAQMAAIAAGRKPRIRVKAGSRKVPA